MVYKSLESLVQIFGLTTFRPLSAEDTGGDIRILQPKDVVMGESIRSLEQVMRVPFDGRVTNYLKEGDIVLVSRCTDAGFFRAALFIGEDNAIVTAGSSLLVLRPHSSEVIPEYLVAYLNSITGQGELHRLARGATMKFLPQGQLKDILIPILPKNQQEVLVRLEQGIYQRAKLLDKQKTVLNNLLIGTTQSLFSPNV